MVRYIDADAFAEKMKRQYCERCDNYHGIRCKSCSCGDWLDDLDSEPTADVRENITAHKVIGGGEHKGATCWFECSRCGKTVDVNDKYCSECGARFEP